MPKQLPSGKVSQSTMIYQHNDLITSTYRLSIPGKRVLAMALGIVGNSDVKPEGTVRDEFPFYSTISVADYAKIFSLPLVNASQDLYAGAMELTTAAVTVYSTRDGKDVRDIFPWLHHTTIEEAKTERGVYTLTLNPDLLRYVGLLETNFTAYDLLNVGRLTSVNQVRLYEHLAQHKNHIAKKGDKHGTWITNFDYFKGEVFDLGDSLKDFPRTMKRRFLDAALDAVNETTDLFVEFNDSRKQWLFKIHSGDVANARREAWRKAKTEAEAEKKRQAKLKRLAKQIEKHKAEEEAELAE